MSSRVGGYIAEVVEISRVGKSDSQWQGKLVSNRYAIRLEMGCA